MFLFLIIGQISVFCKVKIVCLSLKTGMCRRMEMMFRCYFLSKYVLYVESSSTGSGWLGYIL